MSTVFQGVSHLGQSQFSDQLESNLMSWLSWGFLGIGGWFNVTRSTRTAHGNKSPAILRLSTDHGFTAGTLWQGQRSDWVWEASVPYDHQPLAISGVWVNDTFVASDATGTYAHRVLYPEGAVLFDSPIGANSVVEVEHSYRWVQVRRANEPWFSTLNLLSMRGDNPQWEQSPGEGGAWDLLSANRVQLPTVVVEVLTDVSRAPPYEMGNSRTHHHTQRVLFHILTENPWDCTRLHDILVLQKGKCIDTYDKNQVTYPLDHLGTPVASPKTYPQLCAQASWQPLRWEDVSSDSMEELGRKFYWATVHGTFRIGPF